MSRGKDKQGPDASRFDRSPALGTNMQLLNNSQAEQGSQAAGIVGLAYATEPRAVSCARTVGRTMIGRHEEGGKRRPYRKKHVGYTQSDEARRSHDEDTTSLAWGRGGKYGQGSGGDGQRFAGLLGGLGPAVASAVHSGCM
ncbi:hypothetical protein GGTG_00192 [Gaeumannomyces tritici R3-111a-1]|uniref:Uncharacterized protein n=1 Tax=Gaeumannomyces tritici (strain R3-111a-1) TaxID=644352 RepID=J3NFZ9_GAET3|nr:hypothetical protein GGTG_00192 [Gaeumannomyces tritici R3-111a-1]EJT80189.1 hypothetical protein GGTG_00192 [Gaeumannomyces tritici R3-111a-1]